MACFRDLLVCQISSETVNKAHEVCASILVLWFIHERLKGWLNSRNQLASVDNTVKTHDTSWLCFSEVPGPRSSCCTTWLCFLLAVTITALIWLACVLIAGGSAEKAEIPIGLASMLGLLFVWKQILRRYRSCSFWCPAAGITSFYLHLARSQRPVLTPITVVSAKFCWRKKHGKTEQPRNLLVLLHPNSTPYREYQKPMITRQSLRVFMAGTTACVWLLVRIWG
jgi:hypothetical protein